MDSRLEDIRDDLQRITHAIAKDRFPVMSGVVKGIDSDNMQVSVALTVDVTDAGGDVSGETVTNLNVIIGNAGGVYLIPAVGANCIVAEVDGPGQWELLKADAYDKVVVQAGTLVQFNDGSLGGLTKTKELETQINKLNSLVSHLVAIISGAPIPEPGSGANSALQTALAAAIAADSVGDFSDIEDKKVTH